MKAKMFGKKLEFTKETVANLSNNDLKVVHGGIEFQTQEIACRPTTRCTGTPCAATEFGCDTNAFTCQCATNSPGWTCESRCPFITC